MFCHSLKGELGLKRHFIKVILKIKTQTTGASLVAFVAFECKTTVHCNDPKFSIRWVWTNEPRHDKTNKVTVRPAKTQISLGANLSLHWVHTHFVGFVLSQPK